MCKDSAQSRINAVLHDLQPAPRSLAFLLGLSNAVHSADGLQLVRWVEDRLDQQHMRGLDDVQPVGAGVQGQQQDVDLFIVFEGAQVLLENVSDISPPNAVRVGEAGLMLNCVLLLVRTAMLVNHCYN